MLWEWSGAWVLLALWCTLAAAAAQDAKHPFPNKAAIMAEAHFDGHGVRLPTREFTAALREATIDVSHAGCGRSLVILAMANEEALNHTVPHFLTSLSKVQVAAGKHKGQRLDSKLVLVAWSEGALAACRALQRQQGQGQGRQGQGFRHQCVQDREHQAATGSFGFHDEGFNALGFAKIKYILNGLSAGHDVVFLDTDIVVLRDPLPYFFASGADSLGAMEKCLVHNASHALHSPQFLSLGCTPPPINIGVLYFRATAAVTRCVYNWAWEMHSEVKVRPQIWDQDIYNKIMLRCTAVHGVRLNVLDPRVFQSGCFPQCGCKYADSEITKERIGKFSRGHKFLAGGSCSPEHWGEWILRHYPCSGKTDTKGVLMSGLVQGYYAKTAAVIARPDRR